MRLVAFLQVCNVSHTQQACNCDKQKMVQMFLQWHIEGEPRIMLFCEARINICIHLFRNLNPYDTYVNESWMLLFALSIGAPLSTFECYLPKQQYWTCMVVHLNYWHLDQWPGERVPASSQFPTLPEHTTNNNNLTPHACSATADFSIIPLSQASRCSFSLVSSLHLVSPM